MNILSLEFDDCECGKSPVFRKSIRGDKVFMYCPKCQKAGEHMKTPRGAVSRWNKMIFKQQNARNCLEVLGKYINDKRLNPTG